MRKLILITTIAFALLIGCAKDETYTCSAGDPNIIGATCNDGTTSSATGSGACSSHGGVATWTCEN